MRALFALSFVAVVCADNLGYNYHPLGHADSGLSLTPGGGFGRGLDGGVGVGVAGGFGVDNQGLIAPHTATPNTVGGSNAGRLIGANSDLKYSIAPGAAAAAGIGGGNAIATNVAGQNQPSFGAPTGVNEFNKEFYTYTAPEEALEESQATQQVESTLKKNLRVIFIKGPENKGLENAVLNLAKHSSDQKTAIYVLNKQTDINDLANKFNAINSNKDNRPEVHFVKYRTAEDAANAQHQIQAQYDSLQGSTQSHDGVGSVVNFASQAPAFNSGPALAESSPVGQATNSYYLPPSLRRL